MSAWKLHDSTLGDSLVSSLVEKNMTMPSIVREITRGCEFFEGGSRRTFFLNDNVVLKIVYDVKEFALAQQIIEGRSYQKRPDLPLAKCKLFSNRGYLTLLMEKVNRSYIYSMPPEILEYFDYYKGCLGHDAKRQCGYNKRGNIVCYDYGVEDAFVEDDTLEDYLKNLPRLSWSAVEEFEASLEIQPELTLTP